MYSSPASTLHVSAINWLNINVKTPFQTKWNTFCLRKLFALTLMTWEFWPRSFVKHVFVFISASRLYNFLGPVTLVSRTIIFGFVVFLLVGYPYNILKYLEKAVSAWYPTQSWRSFLYYILQLHNSVKQWVSFNFKWRFSWFLLATLEPESFSTRFVNFANLIKILEFSWKREWIFGWFTGVNVANVFVKICILGFCFALR